jgi:acyl dehydratase
MPLDPQHILNAPPLTVTQALSRRDTILYALGVGASELDFVYEEQLQALPTIASIIANPGFFWKDPFYKVDWKRLLHGEISVEWHAPVPVEGVFTGATSFGPIFDKGADKGAVVYQTRRIFDAEQRHIATVRSASFLRGDGGFGGNSDGQPRPQAMPDRAPDLCHDVTTSPSQAILYRLSGDLNPLHIDPQVAQAGGFEKPILHGLCTFGICGRSILLASSRFADGQIRRIDARFASPVFPGETIRTEVWRGEGNRLSFRAKAVERDIVVLNNGYAEIA